VYSVVNDLERLFVLSPCSCRKTSKKFVSFSKKVKNIFGYKKAEHPARLLLYMMWL